MTPDMINALFEFGAAIVLLLNSRAIIRDKGYAGVSVFPVAFFAAWGTWNLYFYPFLGQTWSFVAGVLVLLANLTWIGLMLWFGPIKNRRR